ncbi:hypothetical protein BBP00_00003972 [Phytophthora kernoviae]|uniref:U4/U6.U5 tri-snRNP-associated protein 1 n=1 Tax=Phytophthora kernoviae TaxID=325452 RepID=A0A3F2RSZ1_9STRA|nr:hypothetical protein BBP00_00003972 [Phytophthora kernoviae]
MARSRSRSASRSPRSRRHSSSRRERHSSSRRRSRSRSRGRRHEASHDAPAPKEDKNGEISLSIEETNRLRVQLGLKPLSTGPSKKESAVVNVQKTSEQVEVEKEQQELRRKLQQSKNRRELTQKLAGQSLGDHLKADLEAQNRNNKADKTQQALEWVKQSRRLKKSEKQAQDEEKRDTAEYDAAALAGMTVGHSLDTFEDGQEVVLTLKDSRVLGEDGKDLNEEDDELVNVELREKDRRLEQQNRAKRAAMPVYSGYDDDEFIQVGNARKMRKHGTKMLAHYDEEQDAADAEDAHKFRLDAAGGSAALESGSKMEEDDTDVAVVSLAMDRTRRVEDYYTKEEVEAQFAKHKKGKKLRKKKKKNRRHHDDDLGENDAVEMQLSSGGDAAEDGGTAASLVAQLEKEALQAGATKDRGKRKRSRREDEEGPEEEKLLRFQEAREKANAVASEALAASGSTKKRMKRRVVDDSDVADDAAAIEMELGASLARVRRMAQEQSQNPAPTTATSSEARIALLVSQTIRHVDDTPAPAVTDPEGDVTMDASVTSNDKHVGHVFGDIGSSSNAVVFNEATDFETRLRDAMQKRAAQFQTATAVTNSDAAVRTASATEKPRQDVAAQEQKQEDGMEIDEESKEEGDEDEASQENETWGEDQPLVGTGMGATLALLRKTGDLRQTRVERQAGRANDARDRNFEDDLRIKNGVKLDYRDEFGRLLTKKEAFRMLSYKFHGHEPGKKKKEKRLKQLKEELEAQKLLSGEGSTKMMKVLEKKQKHTKEAHVVLSSGVGEIKHARVVQLSSELQQTQKLNKQLEDDKHEAQVLITALKERLKISDELLKSSKEECRRKLVKLEEDLAKFKFNSEAQIAKLKQRFIKRRLIAHIAQLEKQIASLNIEKKVRQSNRLLALRRHIKQYHCSPRDQIEK